VRTSPAYTHKRSRGREHDHDDQRRAQDEEEQVSELEASSALALRRAQVSHRGKVELGWDTALQQMQQGWDRGGGESQECQRMDESHVVRRRNAIPNGMSVCT